MFWKKAPFRDFAIRELLDKIPQGGQVPKLTALGVMTTAVHYGIAVGSQYAAKVLPIMKQVEGGKAREEYEHMKERVEQRFALATEPGMAYSLRFFPPISEILDAVKIHKIESFTRHQSIEVTKAAFYYGMIMASLHRNSSLRLLEASIQERDELLSQRGRLDLARETAPKMFMTYAELLDEAREAVNTYEWENGTLR